MDVTRADAMQGGFNTAMTYSGSDPETCRFFEKLCGKVRERQKRDLFSTAPDTYREFNLVNADEVRTLAKNETLIVSTNRQPVRLPSYAYFEIRRFNRMAAMGAARLPPRQVVLNDVPLVQL